jgi:DeoR/GlpR family transcriptional regulator of sugar metabolism
MNTSERDDRILAVLREKNFLSVEDAASLTKSSLATIRRDFQRLSDLRQVQRVRGGARPIKNEPMTPFALREVQYSREKELIARAAAAMFRPNDVLIIDGGTTTFHLGRCLPDIPLRIITNSIRLASVLDDQSRSHAGLEVYLTGGFLYPNSGLLVGPGAQASLAQYHAQWALLSVGGVTEEGFFNTSEVVVETERRMIEHADRVMVLADHSKIDKRSMCQVCDLGQVDYLITDPHPPAAGALRRLGQAGLEIITANPRLQSAENRA